MRITTILLSFATLALAGHTTAQSGTVSYIPGACTGPDGAPGFALVGAPAVGQRYDIGYTGPNYLASWGSAQPHLVIGFSVFSPFPIPQGLLLNQPANCMLISTHDFVVPMDVSRSGNYESSYTLLVPNDAGVVGLVFFSQWMTLHTGCGIVGCDPPDWLVFSDAAVISIGV